MVYFFRKENKIQKRNILEELLSTEEDYVKDLRLMVEAFHLRDPSNLRGQGVDVECLFGNMVEVSNSQTIQTDIKLYHQNLNCRFLKILKPKSKEKL